jgi:hypothetical protein
MNLVRDIFTYPVRKGGLTIFLIGTGIWIASYLMELAPLVGGIAALLVNAYFCAVYFEIIQSSANGGDEAPDFPGVSDLWSDIVLPICWVVLAAIISLLPLIAYRFFPESMHHSAVVMLLMGVAVVYFPMALLAVVILGSASGMSPHVVLPAIARAGWPFWLAVLVLIAGLAIEWLLDRMFGGSWLAGPLIFAAFGMYLLMASGRALGLIYREKSEELNWL